MLKLIKPILVLSLTLGAVACSQDEEKKPVEVVTEQPAGVVTEPANQLNNSMHPTDSQLAPVPAQAPVTDAQVPVVVAPADAQNPQ